MKARAAIPCPWWHCSRGGTPSPVDLADTDRVSLRQYCGSAAFDASGRILGFTSPVGGSALFVEIASGRVSDRMKGPDICGIAADSVSGRFAVSSGLGGVRTVGLGNGAEEPFGGMAAISQWDNHLAAL